MTTFGSLFAGIGGFDLGFERSKIKCLFQVEKDKDCLRVLKHHWPDVLRIDDVCKAGKKNLPRVDVITFGSPCQDMSVAGKRKGLHGERSGLFFEAIRIVRELRPSLAVWENVPGAFSSHAGRDFLAAVHAFHELGARDIAWRVLDAQYFGLAQRRERVFLVADFRGERAGEILFERPCGCGHSPKGKKKGQVVAAAIGSSVESSCRRDVSRPLKAGGNLRHDESHEDYIVTPTMRSNGESHSGEAGVGGLVAATVESGGNDGGFRTEPGEHLVAHALCGHAAKGGDPTTDNYIAFHVTQDPISGDIAPAMGTGNKQGCGTIGVAVTHARKGVGHDASTVRQLTPKECCRLQGFPDDWLSVELPSRYIGGGWRFNQDQLDERQIQQKLSDSAKYRMLGNAVAVPVAEWKGKRIKKALREVD